MFEVVSSGFTVEEDPGFVVVAVVGVVCPGNCCGGEEVPGVNVVSSGLVVVAVLEVVSCGFIVDEVVDCGFVVVALVGVVRPGVVGDCCGGGVVGGVDVVSCGFAVVSVLEVVSEVVREVSSGFIVVMVVCVVDSGPTVVTVVCAVVVSGLTVVGVVNSGFNVVTVVPVVDSGPTVVGVVIVSGFGVVGVVCVVVVDCSGFRVVIFPGNVKESGGLNSLKVYLLKSLGFLQTHLL